MNVLHIYLYRQPGEPNGGDFEDCSVINLRSIRFSSSWKDIPCASREVRGYACEYDVGDNGWKSSLNLQAQNSPCHPDMFTCEDGSCILNLHLCDGEINCRNGEDERTDICGNILGSRRLSVTRWQEC